MSVPPPVNRASKHSISSNTSIQSTNTPLPTDTIHSDTTLPLVQTERTNSVSSVDSNVSGSSNTTPRRISVNTNTELSTPTKNLLAKYEQIRNDTTNAHKYTSPRSAHTKRETNKSLSSSAIQTLYDRIAELEAENIDLRQKLQPVDETIIPIDVAVHNTESVPETATNTPNGKEIANNVHIDTSTINLVQYGVDSPFTRKQHSDVLQRIHTLDQKLDSITHRATEYQRALDLLVQHAEQLSHEFNDIVTYTYIETGLHTESSNTRPSLTELQHNSVLVHSMLNLGQMFDTIHNVTSNIKLNVDTFLVYCLTDIRNTYIKKVIDTSDIVTHLAEQHEHTIHRLLNQRATVNSDGTVTQNTDVKSQITNVFDRMKSKLEQQVQQHNNKQRSVSTDSAVDIHDIQQQVQQYKQQYDQSRYDYIVQLNQCTTLNKLELAQYINATVAAFYTYFKDGLQQTIPLKRISDNINSYITQCKPVYNQLTQQQVLHRTDILTSTTSTNSIKSTVVHSTPSSRQNKQHEKSGYLRKQSSNVRKDYKRRWFILKSGQLYYVRSSDDLQPIHVVNAIICHVRASKVSELPYTFDIISPTKRTYTLQAESYQDYVDWLDVLQNATEHEMNDSSNIINNSKQIVNKNITVIASNIEKLKQLNTTCCDCGNADVPDWALINYGCTICIDCSGIHRSLGTHISKVRSLSLDSWSLQLIDMMLAIGNKRFNALYEAESNEQICAKPVATSTTQHKTDYIQYKYVKRIYFNKHALSDIAGTYTEIYHKLCTAVQKGDIRVCMICHALNIDFNLTLATAQKLDTVKGVQNQNDLTAVLNDTNINDNDTTTQNIVGTTPVHVAAEYDQIIVLEYMIQNYGRIDVMNEQGLSVWDVAHRSNAKKVLDRISKNKT